MHPASVDANGPLSGSEPGFGLETARFLFRNARTIFGLAVLAGLAGAVYAFLIQPRKYEASATLVVVPPKYSEDQKPSTLTMMGYQRLLESDAVIEETRRKLVEAGVVKPEDVVALKENLETRIVIPRSSDTPILAPMIMMQVVARERTSERAVKMANTWADVFLVRVRDLMAGSTGAQVKFVEEQYPKSSERLSQLEAERDAKTTEFERKVEEMTERWDGKLLQHAQATGQQLIEFEGKTRVLVDGSVASKVLSVRRERLAALQKSALETQADQGRLTSELQEKKVRLEAARRQLGALSPEVTLRKAIVDDTLLKTLTNGKDPDWQKLQDRCLLTQEPNPLYRDLSRVVMHLEIDVQSLGTRSQQLQDEAVRLAEEHRAAELALRADEAKHDQIVQERTLGLQQLKERRKSELDQLNRQRQGESDRLFRESGNLLSAFHRRIDQERALNEALGKNYNQAVLARSQQNVEDVRLAAMAVPVERPLPRGALMISLLAAATGGLAGILFGLVRDVARAGLSKA